MYFDRKENKTLSKPVPQEHINQQQEVTINTSRNNQRSNMKRNKIKPKQTNKKNNEQQKAKIILNIPSPSCCQGREGPFVSLFQLMFY